MFKEGINFKKVFDNRGISTAIPTIYYFLSDDTNGKADGNIDSDCISSNPGLIGGKTKFEELYFDESMLKEDEDEEDAIFMLCEKVLDMGGRLYIALGLTDDEGDGGSASTKDYYSENYDDEEEDGEYYKFISMFNDFYTAYIKIKDEDCKYGYGRGSLGVFIRKNEKGNYQYDYGCQYSLFYNCMVPPEEGFYMVSDENPDEYEKGVIYIVNQIDIFD